MKNILSLFLLTGIAAMGWVACSKQTNPYFANGNTPTLKVSTNSVAPATADSLSKVLAVSWTNPHYSTDSATELYTIQIDSSGRNFAKAATIRVSGVLNDSLTAKQLNDIALGFGFSFNTAYNLDIRLISSYANNNEQLMSNTVTISYTPYKVPPKVVPPASKVLFIVGNATAGGWNNPVPVMTQQFTEVDSVTYSGNFYMAANGAYDLLPVNGDWSTKYNVASNGVQGLAAGGAFQFSTGPGNDIPGPAKAGIYKILVNFQTGLFSVTPVKLYDLLYVPGDYQGWDPSTAPSMASVNADGSYDGYVSITNTNGFKLTNAPDWNHTNYGDPAGNGESGVLNAGGGNNLNVAAAGYYHLVASTTGLTWSATAMTWGLIGDFNGWSTDVPMTYNSTSGVWTGVITAAADGGFKVRANGAWDLSYGTGGQANSLTSDNGSNIPITAGTHTITMDLHIPGYYTYSIQ
jgi:hypothetical protein